MFIYSVRASTIKLLALVAAAVALLIGITGFTSMGYVSTAAPATVRFTGMKTNEDRVAFIEQFGVKVKAEPLEEKQFLMPENFDRIILGYNELQKKQGLDISKYAKKKVTRYTYLVENYNGEGEAYVNLFVHRNRIIACDICSADRDGFVEPLTLVDKAKLKQTS